MTEPEDDFTDWFGPDYCRFCGPDWYMVAPDGVVYRHDPRKLAGGMTKNGELQHAIRGLKVAWTRAVLLPLYKLLVTLTSRMTT